MNKNICITIGDIDGIGIQILLNLFKKNKIKDFILFTNYKTRIDLRQESLQVSIQLNINKKISLYLSNRNDKSDLFFGDYINKMMAVTKFGVAYSNNNNDLNLAFQNLGAAGYITSISFTKSIL